MEAKPTPNILSGALNKAAATYRSFPKKFWLLVLVVFVDMIGGTLLWPFLSLYITNKFGVGMAVAGVILGINAASGLFGGAIGGALTDKFGRKSIILIGLVFSAVSAIAIGLVEELQPLYPLAVITGILGSISGPAHQAMVADMLPEEKRSEGYGIVRVVANLSWMIGPTIGGFLATFSYLYLFITDAAISCLVAIMFFKLIPETAPVKHEKHEEVSLLKTIAGYSVVIKDLPYMLYLLVSMLMLVVYGQLYNTLSVFMRDYRGFTSQQYGFLLTASAIVVVLTQFWVTTKLKGKPAFQLMSVGGLFYMLGFSMFGIFRAYEFFVAAVVIITIGEMIVVPVSQTLAARFAPEEMRGRYMAFFGITWGLPATFGPWAAGMIMDTSNPDWLWYLGGLVMLVSVAGFYGLHLGLGKRKRFQEPQETPGGAVLADETA